MFRPGDVIVWTSEGIENPPFDGLIVWTPSTKFTPTYRMWLATDDVTQPFRLHHTFRSTKAKTAWHAQGLATWWVNLPDNKAILMLNTDNDAPAEPQPANEPAPEPQVEAEQPTPKTTRVRKSRAKATAA